jgi:hypothetical protein
MRHSRLRPYGPSGIAGHDAAPARRIPQAATTAGACAMAVFVNPGKIELARIAGLGVLERDDAGELGTAVLVVA